MDVEISKKYIELGFSYLEELLGVASNLGCNFWFDFIKISEISLSSSFKADLANEKIDDFKGNSFLMNWSKFDSSLLEFMYSPLIVTPDKVILGGKHRFVYLRDSELFDKSTLIPVFSVDLGSVFEKPVLFKTLPSLDYLISKRIVQAEGGYFKVESYVTDDFEEEIGGVFYFKAKNGRSVRSGSMALIQRISYFLYKYWEQTGELFPSPDFLAYE